MGPCGAWAPRLSLERIERCDGVGVTHSACLAQVLQVLLFGIMTDFLSRSARLARRAFGFHARLVRSPFLVLSFLCILFLLGVFFFSAHARHIAPLGSANLDKTSS